MSTNIWVVEWSNYSKTLVGSDYWRIFEKSWAKDMLCNFFDIVFQKLRKKLQTLWASVLQLSLRFHKPSIKSQHWKFRLKSSKYQFWNILKFADIRYGDMRHQNWWYMRSSLTPLVSLPQGKLTTKIQNQYRILSSMIYQVWSEISTNYFRNPHKYGRKAM